MADQTARFQLPLLAAGQAQKEVFHNEALMRLDALCSPAVAGPAAEAPPASPAAGDMFLVAAGATGDWAGADGQIAIWTDAGWRFVAPTDGMLVWRRDAGQWTIRNNGAWADDAFPVPALAVAGQVVVRSQQPSVADPAAGTVVDTECRGAVAAMLAALRAHGLIAT